MITTQTKRSTRTAATMTYWTKRYSEAHRRYQERTYQSAVQDHGTTLTVYPAVTKANGLTLAITKYLTWEGHRATRINTQGQFVTEKYQGRVVSTGFRTTNTRKGTADISATIMGRAVMIEVKVGRDKPSENQLAEQQREREAGGVYEFIHTIDEFFEWYDQFLLSLK